MTTRGEIVHVCITGPSDITTCSGSGEVGGGEHGIVEFSQYAYSDGVVCATRYSSALSAASAVLVGPTGDELHTFEWSAGEAGLKCFDTTLTVQDFVYLQDITGANSGAQIAAKINDALAPSGFIPILVSGYDGDIILYDENLRGHLRVYPAASGVGAWFVDDARFSPDMSAIGAVFGYVRENYNDQVEQQVLRIFKGENYADVIDADVTQIADGGYISFSPAGELLAYTAYAIPPAGSEGVTLPGSVYLRVYDYVNNSSVCQIEDALGFITWNVDGSKLIAEFITNYYPYASYTRSNVGVWSIDRESGEATLLHLFEGEAVGTGNGLKYYRPLHSPTQNIMTVIEAFRQNFGNLLVINSDTYETLHSFGDSGSDAYGAGAFSKDGSKYAVVTCVLDESGNTTSSGAAIYETAGWTVVASTSFGDAYPPNHLEFSPSGDKLLYEDAATGQYVFLWTNPFSGSPASGLTPPPHGEYGAVGYGLDYGTAEIPDPGLLPLPTDDGSCPIVNGEEPNPGDGEVVALVDGSAGGGSYTEVHINWADSPPIIRVTQAFLAAHYSGGSNDGSQWSGIKAAEDGYYFNQDQGVWFIVDDFDALPTDVVQCKSIIFDAGTLTDQTNSDYWYFGAGESAQRFPVDGQDKSYGMTLFIRRNGYGDTNLSAEVTPVPPVGPDFRFISEDTSGAFLSDNRLQVTVLDGGVVNGPSYTASSNTAGPASGSYYLESIWSTGAGTAQVQIDMYFTYDANSTLRTMIPAVGDSGAYFYLGNVFGYPYTPPVAVTAEQDIRVGTVLEYDALRFRTGIEADGAMNWVILSGGVITFTLDFNAATWFAITGGPDDGIVRYAVVIGPDADPLPNDASVTIVPYADDQLYRPAGYGAPFEGSQP